MCLFILICRIYCVGSSLCTVQLCLFHYFPPTFLSSGDLNCFSDATRTTISIWTKPVSVSPAAKKIDHIYKVLGEDSKFPFTHIPHCQFHHDRGHPSQAALQTSLLFIDWEGCKLDGPGHKIYILSALTLHVANITAIMDATKCSSGN